MLLQVSMHTVLRNPGNLYLVSSFAFIFNLVFGNMHEYDRQLKGWRELCGVDLFHTLDYVFRPINLMLAMLTC